MSRLVRRTAVASMLTLTVVLWRDPEMPPGRQFWLLLVLLVLAVLVAMSVFRGEVAR